MGYLKLWAPAEYFKASQPIFFMSATHRGDMYPLRAALQILKYSVCLYDVTPNSQSLVEYISKTVIANGQHIYTVPWDYNVIKSGSNTAPTLSKECKIDGTKIVQHVQRIKFQIFSENDATRMISAQDTIGDNITKGMAVLSEKSKTDLGKEFEKLFTNTWHLKPDPTSILVLFRDTGIKGGVHPEMDSGDGILGINEIVKNLPAKGGQHLKIFMAGNTDAIQNIPTIKDYWTKFKAPRGETVRDTEAYFLQWAYQHNYFRAAAGSRSGALDLLTLLGIPTISIGLRNYLGESRHELLAKEAFKRLNIQYDQPRQASTAYANTSRGGESTSDSLPEIVSPFWIYPPPQNAPHRTDVQGAADKKRIQGLKPLNFTPFDLVVVDTGFRIAVEKHLNWTKTVESLKEGISTNVTTTQVARYYYPTGLTEKQKIAHFEAKENTDKVDLIERGKKKKEHQEPDPLYSLYSVSSRENWRDIHEILGDLENDTE